MTVDKQERREKMYRTETNERRKKVHQHSPFRANIAEKNLKIATELMKMIVELVRVM